MSSIYAYDLAGPSDRNAGFRSYPDPFLIHSNMLMPRTISEVMRWNESIWIHNGTYSRALKRVVAYFLTKVEVTNSSADERKKYEEFLNDTLNIINTMSLVGSDFMCYGNSFSSCIVPFKRLLQCTNHRCGFEKPIDDVKYSFSPGTNTFKWSCECCKKECSTTRPTDRRISDESKLKIKRWSPHEIKIIHHPITDTNIYLWDPPKDIVQRIMSGDKFILKETPWEMVEAITKGKMFEFAEGIIFHMSEESLSGLRTNGWGMSQTLINFSQAYYVQMAKMYNEVLMQEYIIPCRVVSPAAGKTPQDPLLSTNVGSFNSKVIKMFNDHRRNPGGWHAMPFPIEYQSLGGEGMQMNTYEHIGLAMDELLNAAGVPAELYKGNLEYQALPGALRLFQATWPQLVAQFNSWLNWLMGTLSTVYNWDRAKAKLQQVTLADDLEKRQFFMQLMAGNKLSAETALATMGVDAKDELGKIMDERKELAEAEAKFNEEMSQKQELQDIFMAGGQPMPGQAPPGGAMGGMAGSPAAGPSGGEGAAAAGDPSQMPGGAQSDPALNFSSQGMTPEDMMGQAEQISTQLLRMPYEQRRTQMKQLKDSNKTLHSLVKAKMEDIRGQASSEGGYQALQTMVGGAPTS